MHVCYPSSPLLGSHSSHPLIAPTKCEYSKFGEIVLSTMEVVKKRGRGGAGRAPPLPHFLNTAHPQIACEFS